MSARYESRSSRWHYFCHGERSKGEDPCWSVPARAIDRVVERLFLEAMVPGELELSLAVEREVEHQADSVEKAWRARIEQARYEATRAERRYKAVEPDNRVVARTLEGEWEQRLRDREAAEQQYEEARRVGRVELSPQDRSRIRDLARDLPAVWRAATTSLADRKAMLRLVIEAIGLHPVDVPRRMTRIRVQWHSGAVSEIESARPGRGESYRNAPEVVQRIRELAATGRHDDEVAEQLNAEGLRTGTGRAWNLDAVRSLRSRARIQRLAPDRPRMPPLPHRDPDGRYSVPGAMARFGVSKNVVHGWIARGIVPTLRADCGTHRNVHWLDLDEATDARLMERSRRNGKGK